MLFVRQLPFRGCICISSFLFCLFFDDVLILFFFFCGRGPFCYGSPLPSLFRCACKSPGSSRLFAAGPTSARVVMVGGLWLFTPGARASRFMQVGERGRVVFPFFDLVFFFFLFHRYRSIVFFFFKVSTNTRLATPAPRAVSFTPPQLRALTRLLYCSPPMKSTYFPQ